MYKLVSFKGINSTLNMQHYFFHYTAYIQLHNDKNIIYSCSVTIIVAYFLLSVFEMPLHQ